MKKIFTLAIALLGLVGVANAATIDDLQVCKHSYVLVGDDWTNNGTEKIEKNTLFGDGFFFTTTGHDKATNKGTVDLSSADGMLVTEEIAAKYGEYGGHLNSLRLKNMQDHFIMKVTAKSKIIIFYNNNNADRYPVFSKDAEKKETWEADFKSETFDGKSARIEWTAPDDVTVYIGAENQIFISYLIVEANEAPGTPTVKVGDQTYEGGLWFREVTCKANKMDDFGTVVTYTTDGTTPTAASTLYTAPIKCYQNMTLKFQAFMDLGDGKAYDEAIAPGADNEGIVSFSFDAPTLEVEGATFSITSPYADQNGTNFYKVNGGEEVQGDGATLTESATVTAFTKIVNGTEATFTSKSTIKDVYVLNPIKEKKVIEVTAGDVVLDEEATATSTTGEVYTIENGEISADKMDFFVKDLTFKAVTDAQYQAPEGNERYIQMSNTNITFKVAAGDEVNVKVVCSKNSCKTLNPDNDESVTTDRKCYVNVSGTTYGNDDVTAEDGNIIEFTLKGGKDVTTKDEEGNDVTSFEAADTYYTFQKYSGTGNILISSIEIAPAGPALADFEDGKYYLVNVASEKAWGSGNAWGTQASLVKHPEYLVLHKQENGTYIMETQASNGGDSYYFGGDQGEYMDGKPEAAVALSFIQGEELGKDINNNPVNAYYITSDGTNFYGWDGENTKLANKLAAGDQNAMWLVIPHERAIEALAEATEEDPMDATFLILDPNFSRNNRNQSAWSGGDFGVGGDNSNTNAEKWGGNSGVFDYSQTAEVPNGKYVISWNGFYRYNNTTDNTNDIAVAAHADGTEVINSFVYINGKDYALTSIADETASAALDGKLPFSQQEAGAAFEKGLYQQSTEVFVTDGKLTIGIKKVEHPGCDWTVWDNFELEYYGAIEDGIETVLSTKVLNGVIYNLAGQKVDANYKGVVIKNGKKMLQK